MTERASLFAVSASLYSYVYTSSTLENITLTSNVGKAGIIFHHY